MQVSQYPNITTLADTDLLLVQTSIDGAYKNIAVSDFKLYFGSSSDSSGSSGSTASDSYFNYVVLLLPLSGSDETTTFTDIKGNTVTYVGSAIITTRESKFGDGSLYLLGNEAFLSVASSTTFNFGNNDLDIEFWIYPVATGQQVILERRSTGFTAGDWVIWYSSGGSNATVSMISYDFDGVGNNFISTNNGDVPVNTWSLITIQKSESNWTIRVNGATKGAATTSFSFANSTQPITIGADIAGNGRYYLNAYLQDIRITNGVARYSADFTPSTTEFPQQGSSDSTQSDTSLLLHFDGANNSTTFVDAKGHTVAPSGSPIISTAQSKFGGSSLYLDGNSSLSITQDASLTFASNPFTFECWIYLPIDPSSANYMAIMGNPLGGESGNGGVFLAINAGYLVLRHWVNGNSNAVSAGVISPNAWHHVAGCCASGITNVFLDGVIGASGTIESNTDSNFQIGIVPGNGGYATNFAGYIDELRVTNGQALYTTNFTTPTSAFTQ